MHAFLEVNGGRRRDGTIIDIAELDRVGSGAEESAIGEDDAVLRWGHARERVVRVEVVSHRVLRRDVSPDAEMSADERLVAVHRVDGVLDVGAGAVVDVTADQADERETDEVPHAILLLVCKSSVLAQKRARQIADRFIGG